MTIKELLTSPEYSHSNYIVGLVDEHYDEEDCLWFSMFTGFYNSDWMLDYLRTFVSKFHYRYCVIYMREDWADGTTKLYKVLDRCKINGKRFAGFVSKNDYSIYRGKHNKIKFHECKTKE